MIVETGKAFVISVKKHSAWFYDTSLAPLSCGRLRQSSRLNTSCSKFVLLLARQLPHFKDFDAILYTLDVLVSRKLPQFLNFGAML
jgi:hypothetical protein